MKSSKSGIYKAILLFIVLLCASSSAKKITVEAGVLDFTDYATKGIYKIAPTFFVGIDLHQLSKLSLNCATGVSFSSVTYYIERQNLVMIPLLITIQYHLLDDSSRFFPYIGGGLTLNGIIDNNPYYQKNAYSLTYGYLAIAGVCVRLSKRFILTGNLKYNILIPVTPECPNATSIISTIGFRVPFGK